MKILYLLIIISIGYSPNLFAEKYRVFFKDKGNQVLEYNNDLYNDILSSLDNKAIKRRKINLETDTILSYKDIPIYQNYLDSLHSLNIELISELTWYNYIIVESDSIEIQKLSNFSFVKHFQKVIKNYQDTPSQLNFNNCGEFNYNLSENHIKMLNVDKLHNYGITGQGVRVGFLDTGFDWLNHKSIRNSNVVKTYDFIFRDSIVYNESEDVANQFHHGTVVMSSVAAYDKDFYVGVAPSVDIYLAKTEDLRSETYYELDLFAEAIIWMENNGVDIINASLGYKSLDTFSIPYDNLDGNTTIATKAINDASELGMICVIANGNNGDRPGTLNAPADADSSVAVGAVSPNGEDLVGFSSNGPNSNGVIKPNLVAQGSSIFAASVINDSSYNLTAGTSLSSPLIAGSFALLKSVHPYKKSSTLKSWMYKSANNYNSPNNRFGYGLPDVFKSTQIENIVITTPSVINGNLFTRLFFYIFPDNNLINYSIDVMTNEESIMTYPLIKSKFDNQYFVDIPNMKFFNNKLEIRVNANTLEKSYWFPSNHSFYTISNEYDMINCGIDVNSLELNDDNNFEKEYFIYPNIINSSFQFDVNITLLDYEEIEIEVYDINGEKMFKTNTSFGPGYFKESITLNDIFSGTYFVMIKTGSRIYREKVIFLK
ncbi:MAG: S8 family serine peptidase [Chlorobiota bacterium]